jgi:RNA polymerase sigma-70 factor (ECF subfamily)
MDLLAADSAETSRLLARMRTGDASACGELFKRHRPYLRRLVEFRIDPRLRARVDPSDVVQEAQMEATRRLDTYLTERPMPFRLWLRQIAYDRLLMLRRQHIKAERRAVERDVHLPERSSLVLAQQLLAGGPAPDEQMVRLEFARRVREAVQRLSDADREMMLLRNFEGLSNQEVARLLEIEPVAASKRYGRALLRLRKILMQNGLTESES